MAPSSGSSEPEGWLVLKIHLGEYTRLLLPDGRDIKVRLTGIEGRSCTVSICAPKDVRIHRSDYRGVKSYVRSAAVGKVSAL